MKIKSRENCVQGKQSSKLRTAERGGCRRETHAHIYKYINIFLKYIACICAAKCFKEFSYVKAKEKKEEDTRQVATNGGSDL